MFFFLLFLIVTFLRNVWRPTFPIRLKRSLHCLLLFLRNFRIFSKIKYFNGNSDINLAKIRYFKEILWEIGDLSLLPSKKVFLLPQTVFD